MSHRASLVVLHCVVSDDSVHLVLVYVFEDPALLWDQNLKHHVGVWRLETIDLRYLSEHRDPVFHFFKGLLGHILSYSLGGHRGRLNEASSNQVLPELNLSADKTSQTSHKNTYFLINLAKLNIFNLNFEK